MSTNRKNQLENLLRQHKIKQAQKQLVEDLMKVHAIDISDKEFYQKSEEVYEKVYERIRLDDIKSLTVPCSEELLKSKIDYVFSYYKNHEKTQVLLYPSSVYPIAITMFLKDCKAIILKLMLKMGDDLIVVSEDFKFGFVLSEDEYSDVTIEYWGT